MGARWGLCLGLALAALAGGGCSSSRGSPPGAAPPCAPTTCEAQGKNCGVIPDGCGGSLGCGGCPVGQACGGGGVANVCGAGRCLPATCAAQGKDCGTLSDGCGGTLDCGLCSNGQSCGAGGHPNVCGPSGVGAGVRACSKDGFCWMSPSPAGLTFKATWGSAPNDFWAVGESGYAAHWDGARLALVPMEPALGGIWGSAPDDIWAVGDAIVHWNGSAWTVEARGLGDALRGLFGTSADDIWAVGEHGRVMHWNGHSWEQVPSGTQRSLRAVWAGGPSDVWVAGEAGEVRRFDGTAWTALPKPDPGRAVVALWGSGSGDVWASTENGMYRWNGSGWTRTVFPGTAWTLWGTAPDDLWAAGEYDVSDGNLHEDGFIARWNGSTWSIQRDPVSPVLGMWGTAAGPWFVGRQGSVLQRWDGTWKLLSTPPFRVDGAFVASPSDIWFVASRSQPDSAFTHWDGSTFTTVTNPFGPGGFQALGGSSGTDVWAVGDADFAGHFDGKGWTRVETGLKNIVLTGVWASGPNDAWAVGSYHDTNAGLTLHWNGKAWGRSIAASFSAVWGSAANDVWAVGPRALAHFDGAAWRFVPPAAGASRFPFFSSVWGSGPQDVWAVGSDGEDASNQIWRWNGAGWARIAHPDVAPGRHGATPAVLSVWGTGPNDVYAVGTGGTVLHWDGQAWSRLDAGLTPDTGEALKAVVGAGGDVWLGGRDGAVLRRQAR